jgi:superfamily II DNA/RNA helicase
MIGMVEAREMLSKLAPNTTNVPESAPKGTKRIAETPDMEINVEAPVTASPTLEKDPWHKLTVIQLKDELRSRSLPVSGTKPELVARLIAETPQKKDDQIESQINETISEKKTPPPGTLWGKIPVGPVLRSRLVDRAGLTSPTPVQEAAFKVILKGENAVICSPTGTGKSLAYLVPLLAKLGAGAPAASAIIVTPTVELALQLQREVHDRLGYSTEEDNTNNNPVLHVVGDSYSNTNSESTDNETLLLNSIGNAPFLAGTPKTLLQLLAEAKRSTNNKLLSQSAKAVLFNPKCIVLDEADRLLQTEQIARDNAAAKQPVSWKKKMIAKKSATTATTTQTEILFRALLLVARNGSHYSHNRRNLQLVCASATVGRTLRTQLQQMIGAPSIDKAAVLVTADDRTKKNAESWVVPTGIAHSYRLISTATEEEHKKKRDKNAAAATHQKKGDDDEVVHEATMDALWDTMQQLKPASALVFPGRAGVDRVREGLMFRGLRDVRTLRDLDDGGNNKIDENSNDDPLVVAGWESTTVFVVGEKFARGLDLQPGVDYVFLMSPPSSAAAYAHMAGRTGRNGRPGKAVMLVRPKEATKVVAIAGALGLSFLPVEEVNEIAAAGEVMGTDVAMAAP